MKVLIQWAMKRIRDWDEIDTSQISSIPPKENPGTGSRLDNFPGWINSINIQGVVICAYDHYNFQLGTDLKGEWLKVTAWTLIDLSVPEASEKATEWTFRNLTQDPKCGNAWNTNQTVNRWGYKNASPWNEFVIPQSGFTFHGKQLTDEEYLERKQIQSIHGWREWTEGVPEDQIGTDGKLKSQRAQGLYDKPDGTRTYWLTNTAILQPVVATENELEATDTEPGGSTGTDVSATVRKRSDELSFSWTANGTSVIDTAWVSGSYRFIMDVSSAGADITYALDGTIRAGYEGFNQYDNTNTTVQETKNDNGSAQSGTGIKTFTTGTVSWTDDTATDNKMVVALGVANGNSKDSQTLSVSVNDTDSYIDGPWESSGNPQTATLLTAASTPVQNSVTATSQVTPTAGTSELATTPVQNAATATYQSVSSATLSELVVSSVQNEVSAQSTNSQDATFSELPITPIQNLVTATHVSELTATFSELISTITQNVVSASGGSEITATFSELSVTSIQNTVTSTYILQETASLSELPITPVLNAVTSTYSAEYNTSISELIPTITINSVNTSYVLEEAAGISELTSIVVQNSVSASSGSQYTATLSELAATPIQNIVNANYALLEFATLNEVSITPIQNQITITHVAEYSAITSETIASVTQQPVSANTSSSYTASLNELETVPALNQVTVQYESIVSASIFTINITPEATSTPSYISEYQAQFNTVNITPDQNQVDAQHFAVHAAGTNTVLLTAAVNPIVTLEEVKPTAHFQTLNAQAVQPKVVPTYLSESINFLFYVQQSTLINS